MSEKLDPLEPNPQVVWKVRRRKVLGCSYCKPHRLENAGRKARSDRGKNKRRRHG